jgi:hypothetical protein
MTVRPTGESAESPVYTSKPSVPVTIAGPNAAIAFRVEHFDRVEPDCEQVCRLVQLRPGHGNHRRWFDVVDELLRTLPRLMRPRGIYRIDEVAALERERLVLASGAVFEGAIGSFLEHSRLIATFVVTIGSAVERLSRGWLRAGKVMHGTIADAIASEAASAAEARLRGEVQGWARARGLDITPPYSPGYCGMHVGQQTKLFASLPAREINVRLTPSCLMVPVKSISGLIGIGPADRVSPQAYPCEACDHPNCMQRRAEFGQRRSAGQVRLWSEEACPSDPGE